MLKSIYHAIKGGEKRALFAARYARFLGVGAGAKFCLGNMRGGKLVEVTPPGAKAPLKLRSKTTDIPAFEDTFIFGHYDVEFGRAPEVIVDAGAHIGLVSVLLANRYPEAKIISVEPEPSNFALLSENIAPYPNITPLPRALWFEKDKLDVSNPDDETWCYRVEASEDGTVDTITVEGIMEEFGLASIDLFKIDIEGAEKEVLEHADGWIDKVGALAVELHESLVPGCTRTFYEATKRFPHECHVGENIIVSTSEFRAKPTS